MTTSRVFLALSILATPACAYYSDVLQIDPSPRAPTVADSVRVLAQEPVQTYRVLAIVSVRTGYLEGLTQMSRQLVAEAAKLGGNGVILGAESISETKDWRILTGRVIAFDSVLPPLLR